jgi:hypothetical protein
MPLPITVIAEERRAALGSNIRCAHRADLYEPDRHRVSSRLGPGDDGPLGAFSPQVIQNDIDSIAAELLL